jgi:hypothetical protein
MVKEKLGCKRKCVLHPRPMVLLNKMIKLFCKNAKKLLANLQEREGKTLKGRVLLNGKRDSKNYKHLRNRAINQMKLDTLERNSRRILEAKIEGETWRVVNEILKPNGTTKLTIASPDGDLSEEIEVADSFNKYFVDKIRDLKESIDPAHVKDPLEKIAKKVKDKSLKFSLRTVSTKIVTKIMKQMAKKEQRQ